MLVAKTSIGKQAILIETVEDDVQIVGDEGGRQTQPTAIEDTLGEAYQRAKDVITTMAADFAKDIREFVTSGQKVELEFSLGLSATSGLWVISGKGEAAIKVKMMWEKKDT
jgi:non-canonical (house-cleaning) NTP pyrophosphatase